MCGLRNYFEQLSKHYPAKVTADPSTKTPPNDMIILVLQHDSPTALVDAKMLTDQLRTHFNQLCANTSE